MWTRALHTYSIGVGVATDHRWFIVVVFLLAWCTYISSAHRSLSIKYMVSVTNVIVPFFLLLLVSPSIVNYWQNKTTKYTVSVGYPCIDDITYSFQATCGIILIKIFSMENLFFSASSKRNSILNIHSKIYVCSLHTPRNPQYQWKNNSFPEGKWTRISSHFFNRLQWN